MSEYDGKIQLGMDVSPEDAIKSFKRLQSEAQKSLNKLSTDNLTKSEEKSLVALGKIVSKGEAAAKQIEKLSQPIQTKEYTKLAQEYEKLSQKMDQVQQKKQQLLDKGGRGAADAVKVLNDRIASIGSRLYDIDVEMDKLVAEGKQFTINEDGLDRAKNSLVDINNQLLLQNETSRDIQSAHSAEADNLANQVARFAEIRLNAGEVNAEIEQTLTELTEVNAELDSVRERMAELESAGVGLGYEEYDNLLAVENELVERQGTLNEEVAEYRERMASVEEPMSRWERFKETLSGIWQGLKANDGSFGKLASTLGKIASQFIMAASGANKLKSALQGVTQKATQSSFNFKKLFNTLLKYGIGVRSLFVLYRKIRSAITENIKYYALMNNGMNQTNRAISAMQSSLNALKGALAGAFIPIITHVSPMLTSFIDKITAVVTAIGMFIAKLTGARTYLKAVKKDTNYAAGLSSGGGGKSAQEKYEEAVQKAQEKYDKKVAETEAKNAERMAKAEEKQAKAADKLAKKQEQANDKLASFDDLNVLGTESLEELEEQEADLLDMPELELPSLEDFTGGGGGASDPFGFEEVPLDDFEWNWDDLLAKARELGEKLAEFLNDIFADEDLAKRIGNTIGNLINLAINFAYGFVDKFDFHQFGKWLGLLLQEAIETIDWGLLGDTIGKGLNGIADTIVGFFEGYEVGTLGSSIANMFNRAVEAIDPSLIGQAVLDILQAPLIELTTFLTEANITAAAAKFSEFFHKVFNSPGLKGQTLGTTIGKALGAAINAGVDFILGLDISQLIVDIGMFFTDVFVGAAGEIKWGKFIEAIEHALIGVIEGLGTLVSVLAGMLAVEIEELINSAFAKFHIEIFKQEDIDRQKKEIELLRDGLITTGDVAEGTGQKIATMYKEIETGTQYSFDQLVRLQSGGGLANEQIEKMIETMQKYAKVNGETFDAAALGLEGYTGDWQSYRDTVLGVVDETNEKITSSKDVVDDLSSTADLLAEKTKNVGNTVKTEADTTAEKLDHTAAIGRDHLGILDEAINTSDQNVTEFSDSAVEAISKVDAKTGEVSINFEQMTALVQTQLDSLTTMIDTWYQEMITQYFSYDAWLLMLQEGPLLAITEFFTVQFLTFWDTQMEMWWTEHLLIWFSPEKWDTDVFTPWKTNVVNKWRNLMTWWDTMMQSWWNGKVVPWFQEKKWEEQFEHVYKVAQKVGEKTRNKVTELAEETAEAVHNACEAMKNWIQEIIEMLGEAIEMANELAQTAASAGDGGGSSSGGSHGGSSGSFGGGSRTHNFMPMLDIMHFEDNLGMSAFKFPELATGAVIPPNNEFLAVLGDQRNGMNIETPLATMIEAFRSVMDEYMSGSHQSATMEVDGETFARLMMPHIMDEMNRLGYNVEIIEGI